MKSGRETIGHVGPGRTPFWAICVVFEIVLCLTGTLACSSTPYVWADEVPVERARPQVKKTGVGRGDVVNITVLGQASLSSIATVNADGTVNLPNVGAVMIAGQTQAEAATTIERSLANILQQPRVSVTVVSRMIQVSLLGEVRNPGKYLVQSGDGIATVLAQAGGLTEFAGKSSIYLVRESEPRRIRFRFDDLLSGGNSARAFILLDGDILLVK